MLYLVPTPIGNRGDMTPRGIEVLSKCDLILAEDTRVSRPFLKFLGIDKPVQSFHSNNEHKVTDQIIEKLKSGQTIGMVTDAGTPGISDPAFLLVRACRKEHIEVIALPGATAFVPALVASGLPCEKFFFQGFLPPKKGRHTQLLWLTELPCTLILYESPHRLIKGMEELNTYFGSERLCCASKEISKLFEAHYYGTLGAVLTTLKALPKILGEWVICIEGKPH